MKCRVDKGPQCNEEPDKNELRRIAAVPCEMLCGNIRRDVRESSILHHRKREDDGESDEHKEELEDVRLHIGTKAPGEQIDSRGKRAEYDAHKDVPSRHHFQQHTEHQHVRGRRHQQERQQCSEQRRGPAIGLLQFVRNRCQVCCANALCKQKCKYDCEDVVRDALYHPIRYAVPVGKLPHTQNAAVPGRHERHHKHRGCERPSGQKVLRGVFGLSFSPGTETDDDYRSKIDENKDDVRSCKVYHRGALQ